MCWKLCRLKHMTIEIGTKVQISDNYLAHVRNPDESVTRVRGKVGTVIEYNKDFLVVLPAVPDDNWGIPYLFLPQEVVILEEAHPLQKEHIKS